MSTPATQPHASPPAAVPLCVDPDGTLLRTDLLLEGILRLLRCNPASIFLLPLWALRGRATLKAEVARRTTLAVDILPVNQEFLGWLRAEKSGARRLVICTGASWPLAEAVARRFGIFDEVIASGDAVNLSGSGKAERLVARFGERCFDYAGSSLDDLPVWRRARAAIVVEPTIVLAGLAAGIPRVDRVFRGPRRLVRAWLRACRLHQWSKNILVAVPALASHGIADPSTLAQVAVAFASFSLAASGNYLLNDLLDLDSDRAHASKQWRAFASGELRITEGVVVATILALSGLALGGYILGPAFLGVLVAYLGISLWYSFALKRQPMVDIMCLAALYTMRIVAGSVATGIELSFWLLAFSMFLFLSLAAAKRVSELRAGAAEGVTAAAGRGYDFHDVPLLVAFGVTSGYLSVLVMALYVASGAEALYREPRLLWLLCPVLLYWVSRIWLRTHRGTLHEDPVVFALTDRPSLLAGAVSALLIALAV